MQKIYIQYFTDFHLLAALSAVQDVDKSYIILIGPRSKTARFVLDRISGEHIDCDPRRFKVSIFDFFRGFLSSQKNKSVIIISPFVFPFFTLAMLFEDRVLPALIIRTDEGVGSYASIYHLYNSFKAASIKNNPFYIYSKAVFQRACTILTSKLRICHERYIFNKHGVAVTEVVERFKDNINKMGYDDFFDGRTVYVSQPYIDRGFISDAHYVEFIKNISSRVSCGDLIVKRHPADYFDYSRYGLECAAGLPLELYALDNSVVIGHSSTALLTSKVIGGASRVYYIRGGSFELGYSQLSTFNKLLFDRYLEPIIIAEG